MVRHFIHQPLPASFMLISILGFLFGSLIVWELSVTWGFTITLTFGLWFIASVINFTHADSEEILDIHDSRKYVR